MRRGGHSCHLSYLRVPGLRPGAAVRDRPGDRRHPSRRAGAEAPAQEGETPAQEGFLALPKVLAVLAVLAVPEALAVLEALELLGGTALRCDDDGTPSPPSLIDCRDGIDGIVRIRPRPEDECELY